VTDTRRRPNFATIGAGGLVIAAAFVAGHFTPCIFNVCIADGNPVGYHLSGAVKVPQQNLSLSGCPQSYNTKNGCTLILDISIGKNGNAPSQTPTCPTNANCASFEGTAMTESSVDDNMTHQPDETPYHAAGAFQFLQARTPPKKGATSRPNSRH